MSLVRDSSASRPEREEEVERGSAGTSDWELSWEARERDQLLLTARAVEQNRFPRASRW